LTNNKGNTLIEMIMVMTLLALFSVTIYTLIFAGGQTQQKIQANKDAQVDARIGLNYINVKLRQNDAAGWIDVRTNPLTGGDAIVISRPDFAPYEMWIFFCEGERTYLDGETGEMVTEAFGEIREGFYDYAELTALDADKENLLELAICIIAADGFRTVMDAETGAITNTVLYTYDGKAKELSTTLQLKSGKAE